MFIKADVQISSLLFWEFVLLEVLELLSDFQCAVVGRNCSFGAWNVGTEDLEGLVNSLALVECLAGDCHSANGNYLLFTASFFFCHICTSGEWLDFGKGCFKGDVHLFLGEVCHRLCGTAAERR